MIYERMEKLRQVFSRSHIVTHGASLEYAAARVTISHAVAYQSPVVSRQSPVVSRQSFPGSVFVILRPVVPLQEVSQRLDIARVHAFKCHPLHLIPFEIPTRVCMPSLYDPQAQRSVGLKKPPNPLPAVRPAAEWVLGHEFPQRYVLSPTKTPKIAAAVTLQLRENDLAGTEREQALQHQRCLFLGGAPIKGVGRDVHSVAGD